MRTTVSLGDELAAHIDEIRPQDDDSDAEAVREAVRRSRRVSDLEDRVEELESKRTVEIAGIEREYEEQIEELQQEIDSVTARKEDLQRQLGAANRRIDSTNELVAAVETDMNYREKKAKAGILQRARWWISGMDDGDDTKDD